jgi:hypothetical protein
MIYHIKDLINPYYQECIKSDLEYFESAWVHDTQTVYGKNREPVVILDKNVRDIGQDVLNLYTNEDSAQKCLFFFIKPLILSVANQMQFKLKDVHKAKFNRLHQDVEFTGYNIPHRDMLDIDANYYSFVYYVKDSDGDTVFFDNNDIIARFTPKQGDIVFFKSNIMHASCNPKQNKERIVLNVVMEFEQ